MCCTTDDLSVIDLGSDFEVIDAALYNHGTCALSSNRTVVCFGESGEGETGVGTADIGNSGNEMGDNLEPVDLGSDFVPYDITAGMNSSFCFQYVSGK